jgi:hypothetical protein
LGLFRWGSHALIRSPPALENNNYERRELASGEAHRQRARMPVAVDKFKMSGAFALEQRGSPRRQMSRCLELTGPD